MKLTVGVIGCGNISRFHFSGLEKAGARVKWVCDISPERAQQWAAKTGACVTADYRAIVKDPAVNTIVITALSSLHKSMCMDAIHAGKAVICEKTLAEDPADALDIVRLAARR